MNDQSTEISKPKRSIFGKICKWGFILFNALMAFWVFGGVGSNVEQIEKMADGSAEQAGAIIGTGLAGMMLVFIWVAGAIILGIFVLLTRPK